MRKVFAFLFILALFIPTSLQAALTDPGKQAELESPGTSLRKLQRGFLNVALSPIDISHELDKEKKKQTLPPSWVMGLGRGAAFAAGRAVAGVFEIVTFWWPTEPIVQPEFAWEHLEKKENLKQT